MIQVLAGEQYAPLAIYKYLCRRGTPVRSEALSGEDQLWVGRACKSGRVDSMRN